MCSAHRKGKLSSILIVVQVVAGNRAGAVTILLDVDRRYTTAEKAASLQGERKPQYIVHSFAELEEVVQSSFALLGSAEEQAILPVANNES